MVKHLFADFMQDDASYAQAEALWSRVCREAIRQSSSEDDWEPWLRTHFADGSYFEKGNPICNLKSATHRKAIRIIQQPPSSRNPVISAWTDGFGENDDSIDELVINCELSDETVLLARHLIEEWIGWQSSKGDFQQCIDEALDAM